MVDAPIGVPVVSRSRNRKSHCSRNDNKTPPRPVLVDQWARPRPEADPLLAEAQQLRSWFVAIPPCPRRWRGGGSDKQQADRTEQARKSTLRTSGGRQPSTTSSSPSRSATRRCRHRRRLAGSPSHRRTRPMPRRLGWLWPHDITSGLSAAGS